MFARALLIAGSIALTLPALAKAPDAPPGWTQDSQYSKAGVVIYTSPDKKVIVVAGPGEPPSDAPLGEWLAEWVAEKMRGKTVLENKVVGPENPGSQLTASRQVTHEVANGDPITRLLIAKRFDPRGTIQTADIEIKPGASERTLAIAKLLALTVDMPVIDKKTSAKIILEIFMRNDAAKRVAAKKKADAEAQAAADAKAAAEKAEAERAAQTEGSEQQALLAKRRTNPGEGLKANELHGIAYDKGRMKHDVFTGIWREVGVTTWLLLKDGWAYRAPDIAPADFDAAHSRKIEPKRWVEWKTDSKFRSLSFYEPLAKGTRVKLSVKRPRVSGWRGAVTSSTQHLNLYDDGRFDISSFSLTSSDLTSDGSNTATISKAESKDGSSSSVSGQTSTGSGIVSWQREKGINPGNMGSYFIDGLTIELKFDDGTVLRKVFAMRGKGNVILDRTNYWE